MSHRLTTSALTLLTAALLAACGGPSEQDTLGAARTAMEKREFAGAIIHLKTVLQKDGKSGEARYLLGKALYETGDVVAASVELRKAQEQKYEPSLVQPLLAKCLLAQGEARSVVTQFTDVTLTDKAGLADLKVTLAAALLGFDEKDKATAAIAAAEAAVPGHVGAGLLRARMTAAAGDLDKAATQVDAVLQRDGKSAEAWVLKGELMLARTKDRKGALEAFRQAIAIRPNMLTAHLGAVSMLLQEGDIEGAKAQTQALKKQFPNNAQARLLEAEVAFKSKDYKASLVLAKQVVQAFPSNPAALQMAGAAEYQLGSLQQAETYLAKALQIAPKLPVARRVLARIYLRTGQPQKASSVLQPELAAGTTDPLVLQMAAEAALLSGESKEADELFARAAKAKPNDPRIRTAMALSQFAKGKGDSAITELESIAESDNGGLAELALVSAHIRRKEVDQALKVIDSLEKKQPDKPLASLLRGRVLALRNDAAGARAAFEKAHKIDPKYFPAIAALAAVDLAEGKGDAARKRFEEARAADPKNLQATLGLAGLLARGGNKGDEVTKLLGEAVKLSPNDPRVHLQLTQHLLERHDTKAALAAVREGLAALPDHPSLLMAQGRAFLLADDTQQAITTFNRLAAVQPKSPQAYLGLADANVALKDRAAAMRNLKRALELAPGLLQAQRGLVALLLADKRPQDALDVARQVQKERPGEAVGLMLEGDVELARKNLKGATVAYQGALKKKVPAEAAMRLHSVMLQQGQAGEAELFAQRWMADHASDASFAFYLADRALRDNSLAIAELRYREVLKLQPNNALALNNLAWLLVKQSKQGSVEAAEQANKLMPGRPALMDTLSTALAFEKQLPRAVEVQKQAVERAPSDGGLRVNLARLYIQSDQKAMARQELERVSKMGRQYSGQDQVQELLKGL